MTKDKRSAKIAIVPMRASISETQAGHNMGTRSHVHLRVGNPVKELEMKSTLSLYELAITVQNLGENGQFLRKLEPFS